LVDDVEGMTGDKVRPRRLLTVEISLTSILDLRVSGHQEAVGLTMDDLMSETSQHARCQRVGSAAHQLGLHGILAPAATGLGETLAVYELHLTPNEQPVLIAQEQWPHLPSDPRIPRTAEIEPASTRDDRSDLPDSE
jgi:hypothetical protein